MAVHRRQNQADIEHHVDDPVHILARDVFHRLEVVRVNMALVHLHHLVDRVVFLGSFRVAVPLVVHAAKEATDPPSSKPAVVTTFGVPSARP